MADENYSEEDPPIIYDRIPPQGDRRKVQDQPINRKVSDILYDTRSIYRGDYQDISPPYHAELPWKPANYKPTPFAPRGVVPGYNGPKYTDPYSTLKTHQQSLPAYESSGAKRSREILADDIARQREHDRAIPGPTMMLEEQPADHFTEYRSMYCKTKTKDDVTLPDIRPMNKGLYKYYHTEDSFSYNSQHRNQAY